MYRAIPLRNGAGRGLGGVGLASVGWRAPLLAAALLLGIAGRFCYGWNAPLWFDETFSAVIATQPSFARLLDWCLHELTGPAFYMPLWAWVKIAGSSDMALRAPSLLLSVGGPLLILWKGDRDPDVRLWWAVFALLWVPMFGLAGEARPYPQLFLLGAVQAMLFVRLIETPSTARASGWVIASSLLVLTHYWGVVPCVVQGVAYLACHRWRAARTAPALLFALPMAGWAYVHLPMVLGFTIGHDGMEGGLPLSAVAEIPAMLLGVAFGGVVVLGTVIGSTLVVVARRRAGAMTVSPALVLAWCGVVTIALMLVLAFIRPGFAARYATPSMPSFLFALALWARCMGARDPRAVIVVTAMMLSTAAGMVAMSVTQPDRDPRHLFNLERPSAWIEQRKPDRLVFLWDGPVGAATPGSRLDEIGGFFLRRGGRSIPVNVARASPGENPNRAVLALAGEGRRTAILWTANDALPASRTPHVERYDARFECRDFGGGALTMTACRRRD